MAGLPAEQLKGCTVGRSEAKASVSGGIGGREPVELGCSWLSSPGHKQPTRYKILKKLPQTCSTDHFEPATRKFGASLYLLPPKLQTRMDGDSECSLKGRALVGSRVRDRVRSNTAKACTWRVWLGKVRQNV